MTEAKACMAARELAKGLNLKLADYIRVYGKYGATLGVTFRHERGSDKAWLTLCGESDKFSRVVAKFPFETEGQKD